MAIIVIRTTKWPPNMKLRLKNGLQNQPKSITYTNKLGPSPVILL